MQLSWSLITTFLLAATPWFCITWHGPVEIPTKFDASFVVIETEQTRAFSSIIDQGRPIGEKIDWRKTETAAVCHIIHYRCGRTYHVQIGHVAVSNQDACVFVYLLVSHRRTFAKTPFRPKCSDGLGPNVLGASATARLRVSLGCRAVDGRP